MTRKTDEQITVEIAALKEIKPKVRRFTVFNDDNHAAIDAQILVLERRYNIYEVHDSFGDDEETGEFPEDSSEHEFSNALRASDWLYGRLTADEDYAPSTEWKDLT